MKSNKKKNIIIIDGSNFYFKLKDLKLQNLSGLDLSGFLQQLSEKFQLVKSGFSHQPSVAMVANCTSSRLLIAEDFKPFFSKK